MRESLNYDGLVLAGGGCRCFWQLAFLETLREEFDLAPRQIAAVSAGAAMACSMVCDRADEVIEYFCDRAAGNEKNFRPENLFRSAPSFPHEEIYRDTILHCCDDDSVRKLHAGPEVRVLFAQLPSWLGPRSGVAAGFLAYEAEKLLKPNMHPRLAAAMGFRPDFATFRDCSTASEVAELILQSSCTPPFTPVYRRSGAAVLDGGLVDNVPVMLLSPDLDNVLVLVTRPYRENLIPKVPGRTYVQPSEPIPVYKWDYTSPELVQATVDLGRRDAEAFLSELRSAS